MSHRVAALHARGSSSDAPLQNALATLPAAPHFQPGRTLPTTMKFALSTAEAAPTLSSDNGERGRGRLQRVVCAAFVLALAFALPSRARAAALPLTVAMTSDSALTLDSNSPASSGPHAMYVSFRIANTSGAQVANLQATISGFGSGTVLSGGQAATQYVGTLAAGASRTVYWFITYPSSFNVRNVLTVSITDGAGGTASGSGAVRTMSMISAQAGGLTSTSSIGPGAVVGQVIPLDVTFQFKGWKTGDSFNLQPAGNEAFPAGCFQLVKTQIVSADANLSSTIVPGTLDRQYFVATSPSSGGGSTWDVGVRYYFKYLCQGSTGTPLPYSNELSGTQLKYSANYGVGGGNPGAIPAAPSPAASFTVAKTASVTQLASGGTVTYTVAVHNLSSFDATLDSIVDVLPGGTSYSGIGAGSGVTAANSGSVPSNGSSGTVVWRGNPGTTYAVTAGGTLNLVYTVSIPSTAGEYTNSAAAYVGSTQLGTSNSTVTVGTADVSVVKTGPGSAVVSDTVRYALTVSNAGPSAAYRVVVRDSLPAGVTFVSATNGGTAAGGVVTWPTLASLASGTSVVDSVTVVMPATLGSIVNIGRSAANSYDPVPANNDGSATASRATVPVGGPVVVTPDGLASPLARLPGTRYSQTFTVQNASSVGGSYDLLAYRSGTATVFQIDSLTGPGITTRVRQDSSRVTLAARTSYSYLVWYTVSAGDTAQAVELLRARSPVTVAYQDTGWVQLRRAFPALSLTKAVSPNTTVIPGTDLTYTLRTSNAGSYDATGVAVADSLPPQVQLKVGSAGQTLPAGVTSATSYSQDGSTWAYTPASGGCGAPSGYDGCVKRIRWTFTGTLPPDPATSLSVLTFVVRIR
jgi:uncharacterized repeat protein (TIGR01451 family)